jgi:hypothetical protein
VPSPATAGTDAALVQIVGGHRERIGPLPHHRGEGAVKLVGAANRDEQPGANSQSHPPPVPKPDRTDFMPRDSSCLNPFALLMR